MCLLVTDWDSQHEWHEQGPPKLSSLDKKRHQAIHGSPSRHSQSGKLIDWL